MAISLGRGRGRPKATTAQKIVTFAKLIAKKARADEMNRFSPLLQQQKLFNIAFNEAYQNVLKRKKAQGSNIKPQSNEVYAEMFKIAGDRGSAKQQRQVVESIIAWQKKKMGKEPIIPMKRTEVMKYVATHSMEEIFNTFYKKPDGTRDTDWVWIDSP